MNTNHYLTVESNKKRYWKIKMGYVLSDKAIIQKQNLFQIFLKEIAF